MATTRRDIELLISARETTGRSFKEVTDNISALNLKIGEQVQQAERGEISLQELRKTQEALASAGRDLSAIQGQIDAYIRLSATTEKVAAAAEKAQSDLAELKAKIEAAGKSTTAQENKLERLENAVVRTSAAVEKNTADLVEQAAVLGRAGIATEELDRAQAGIVNTARQIGAGLVQVNSAITDYSGNVARATQVEKTALAEARDAEQKFAAEDTFQRKLTDAGKLRDSAEYVGFWVRALDEAEAKEREFANQSNFERKISEAQRLGQASKFVQLFGDSVNTVRVADNQLAALSGFRALGQQAVEAAGDVSRFTASADQMAPAASRVADGLRAIIDPGNAALKTLDGVEQAIREANDASGEGVKNANILNAAYNNLAEASSALLRQGALVDSFNQQAAAAERARNEFSQAQAEVVRLGTAMAQADQPTDELVRSLQQAETRLESAGRALAAEDAKLDRLSAGLKEAAINTADLANEQRRLEGAASTAGAAMDRIATATGRGGGKTNAIFGLKPQDLTNVGYQLNDIFVSLASGQKPLTVFIQQGAQLAQIPGLLSGVAGAIARFFPLIAVLTAVGSVAYSAYESSERLSTAMKDLANIPNGGALDPQKFADAQEKLEGVGAKAEEAREALLALANAGFDTAQITEYSEAAGRLSERLGVDVVEATKLLIDVQQGGIEAVYDLTQKTHDLTDADLDHVEALYEAGRAGEARAFVLDKIKEKEEAIASATQSQWVPAINNLKTAWSNLTSWLSGIFSPLMDQIQKQIDSVVLGFTYLTALMAGKGFDGAKADAYKVFQQQQNRGNRPAAGGGASDQSIRDRQYRAQLEAEKDTGKKLTKEERLRAAATEARTKAQAAGVSSSLEDLAVMQAVQIEQRKIASEEEKANKKSANASKRAARAAEAEQRKREQAQQQLENQLRQLNRAAFSGASATLDERLEGINEKYEKIADSIKKVRALGITKSADGTDLKTVEAQVEATKTRLKNEETIKFYQEQASLLDKQRKAEIDRIADAQSRGALTAKQAMEQTAEIEARLSPQIVKAAEQALAVARALAGTNPSPEMVSWIASLERIISDESSSKAVAEIGKAGLDKVSGELNDILKQRDELVDAFSTLNDLGLKSSTETRAAIAGVFQSQAEAARPILDRLRETVEALHNQKDALTGLPILTDTAYATWLAKIEAVNAGLNQTDTKLTQLERDTLNNVANAGVGAFNTLSSSMAGFIAGTKSLGDVFADVGRSILQSLAEITQAIANAIIKFLILRALESAAGLPPGTLSAGGGGGGGGGLLGGFFKLFHGGGVVGKQGTQHQRRTGMSASWAGAPKFHNGGGLGLKPDEYKAVLKRGEEVLTDDDPRHVNNLGAGDQEGGANGGLKQVLLLDPAAVPNAMRSRSGQRSILTVIRENKETIKQVLK